MHWAHETVAEVARWSRSRSSVWAWGVAASLGLFSLACEQDPPAAAEPPAVDDGRVFAPGVAVEPTTTRSSGPPVGLTPPTAGQERLVGIVVEHLPAGGYHYLRVASAGGQARWVVTMGGEFDEGMRVEVESLGVQSDFHSRRLGRRFDELVFGVVSAA